MRTSTESTLGRGTNTVGGTTPTTARLGVVGDLHRHRAVLPRRRVPQPGAPPPRAGPSRAAGRRSARARAAARPPGTATLYGRFDTHAHGPRRAEQRRPVDVEGVGDTHLAAPRRPGRRRASRHGLEHRGELGVELHARGPRAPASSRASVSEPSPGPISTTTSPSPSAASATIRRAVFGSARKCWPRLFLGWMRCSSSSACTVAGVSTMGG